MPETVPASPVHAAPAIARRLAGRLDKIINEAGAQDGTEAGLTRGLRAGLQAFLPPRFALAEGVIVSSNAKLTPVGGFAFAVIDAERNTPLLLEPPESPPAELPVELVHAALVTLADVSIAALERAALRMGELRRLARRGRYYETYVSIKKPNGKSVAAVRELRLDTPPRVYVIAGQAGGLAADALAKQLRQTFPNADDTHLDGLLVLREGWFLAQPDNKNRIEHAGDRAALRFCNKLLLDLDASPMYPLALDRYADPD